MSDIRSSIWKLLAQTSLPTIAVARLHFEGGGYIPVSTGPVTLDGDVYLPLLASIPIRDSDIDFYTRDFTVANMILEILDSPFDGDTRFSDLLSTKNFEGQTADVRLFKPGITSFEDCLPRFIGGRIRRTPTSRNRVMVHLEDGTALNLTKDMPVLSQDDATAGYILPEASLGKIKPRVLGSHLFPINLNVTHTAVTAADWVGSRVNNVSPMRHLGGRRYMVSSKEIAGGSVTAVMQALGASVWAKDKRLNRLVELNPGNWVIVQNDANGCIIERTGSSFNDYRLPLSVSNAWVDSDNAIDRDVSTEATVALFPGGAPQQVSLDLVFPENDIPVDSDPVFIQNLFVFIHGAGDWLKTGDAHLFLYDSTLTTLVGEYAGLGEGSSAGLYSTSKFFGVVDNGPFPDETLFTDLNITAESDAGLLASADYSIREIYMRVGYFNPDEVDLFWGGPGETFTAEYDLANRPNNADTAETGNEINTFTGALEWYLRQVTLLGDNDIELDTLDAASNLVAGLLPSFFIAEQPDSTLDLFFKLVQSYKAFAVWDELNKVSIQILKDDYLTPDVVIDGTLMRDIDHGRTDERRLYGSVQVQYGGSEDGGRGLTPLDTDAAALDKNNLDADQSYLLFDGFAYLHRPTAIAMGTHFKEAFKLGRNNVMGMLPEEFAYIQSGSILGYEDLPTDMRGKDLQSSYVIGGQTFRPLFMVLGISASNTSGIKATQVAKLVT